jgi:RNA polymerase sigma-70 factor (ECF subfamily)
VTIVSDVSLPATQALAPSLTAVHEAHADFVWRCLQRLGVALSDLEDLHQEVFLVVHKQLKTFDNSLPLRPWLFGICTNVAAAHRRRAYHRRETLVDQFPEDQSPPRTSPEEQIATQQELRRLEIILNSMDLHKRAVFVMFEIEGLACADIASALGVPIGTVYSRLNAARDEFQAAARRLQARSTPGGCR